MRVLVSLAAQRCTTKEGSGWARDGTPGGVTSTVAHRFGWGGGRGGCNKAVSLIARLPPPAQPGTCNQPCMASAPRASPARHARTYKACTLDSAPHVQQQGRRSPEGTHSQVEADHVVNGVARPRPARA